jgi:nitrogen regulatory protein PII
LGDVCRGTILVTGNTGSQSPEIAHDPDAPDSFTWVVTRLRADGRPDPAFGTRRVPGSAIGGSGAMASPSRPTAGSRCSAATRRPRTRRRACGARCADGLVRLRPIMKKVEAFIRHEAFEPIRNDLLNLGFPSLSISEVKGSGRQKGITERYRGAQLTNWLRPKVKLECVVATRDVETVVETILKHARTGSIGDGKVFVMPVEEAYRIRTGESGEETLQAHPGAADELA